MAELARRCGNCAFFASETAFLPSGFCPNRPETGGMTRAEREACLLWQADLRGLGPGGSEPEKTENSMS